jgi:hypothetical protein
MNPSKSGQSPRLFEVLLLRLEHYAGQQIQLSDLLLAMGDRSFGLAFMLFGFLAAVLPAVICSIMSIPIILFSLQLLIGRSKPSIPNRLNQKKFDADTISLNIRKSLKWLNMLTLFAKPRWPFLNHLFFIRLAAFFCLILALVILIPGPFTNSPPGIAIVLFGAALAERDGILLLISFVLSLLALLISMTALVALYNLILIWLQ